jgi:hypothetical protein
VASKSSIKAVMHSTEVIQRAAALAFHLDIPTAVPALQVEIPTVAAVASSPDPSMGKEGLQADLDTAVGANASSLDPKSVRILSEAVAAMWEVQRLRKILPTASRVPGYSNNPVKQKRSSHICLIIEILA